MSMREDFFHENGFVFTPKVCAYMIGYFAKTDPDIPAWMREMATQPNFFELAESGELSNIFFDVCWLRERLERDEMWLANCNEFYGVAKPIDEMLDGESSNTLPCRFDGDTLLMIPLIHKPELFKQAYADKETAVQEILDELHPYMGAFPDGFDIGQNICEVEGTQFH